MQRKRKSKTVSLMEIWEKQQSEQDQASRKRSCENGDQNYNPEPSSKTNAPAVRRYSSFGSILSPLHISDDKISNYTSTATLTNLGFDEVAGKTILYPAGEFIRPYELSILKKCLSGNTCISLPGAGDPIPIVALTFINFARWFPDSISIFCYNSFVNATHFKDICEMSGFKENQITIIPTYTNFKKKKEEDLGRIIVSTPQCFQKIVESESPILQKIRCGTVYLDDEESFSKHSKFIGALFAKGLSFRLLTIVPYIPNYSLRTAVITKRQSLITSLLITNWQESKTTDEEFRRAAVPLGVKSVYWKKVDISPLILELITFWKKGCMPLLKEIQTDAKLPSIDIDGLLNIEWIAVQKECEQISEEIASKCEICSFLVTAYRHLLLSGPRVFYLFCTEILNDPRPESLSEQLQITILNAPLLSKVFEKIQAEYSYNTDSIVNVTCNPSSLSSHIKFAILLDEIQNYIGDISHDSVVRGLVVCESIHLSRTVCEALSTLPDFKIILGVPKETFIDDKYCKTVRNFNKMSGLFAEKKNVIAVISFEDSYAFGALDTIASNRLNFIIAMGRRSLCLTDVHTGDYCAILNEEYEKLRENDGRLILQDSQDNKRKSDTGRVGAVNKYSFKYEPSRLSLNLKNTKLQFLLKSEDFEKVLNPKGEDENSSDDSDSENYSFEDPSYVKPDDEEENQENDKATEEEKQVGSKSTETVVPECEEAYNEVVFKYDNIIKKLDSIVES